MKKKSVFLLLFLSVAIQSFAAWTGGKTQPGTTTIDGKSYYSIKTPNHLAWFAAKVNGGSNSINAVLSDNIVMGSDNTKTCGTNWTPIGTDSKPFNGIFDGNGKIIYGLKASGMYSGLFGHIGKNGIVKNFLLNVGNVSSNYYAGAVVSRNYGAIYNVGNNSVKVTSSGDYQDNYLYAGGIAGENKGEIRYCYNKASVNAKANISSNNSLGVNGYAGGIAADNEGLIWNSRNHGWVGSQLSDYYGVVVSYAGGIAAINNGEIKHVGNYAEVVANASSFSSGYSSLYVGGIAGYSYNGSKLWDAISTGRVKKSSGNSAYSGGIIGINNGKVGDCVIYDKSVASGENTIGKNNGSLGKKVEGWSTSDMKKGQFAYNMNMLCGVSTSYSGVWAFDGSYPIVAMSNQKATKKVVFKNGNMVLSTQYSNPKGQVTFPATPAAAENYVFEAWYTSGGAEVNSSSVFTQNETVSAKFVVAPSSSSEEMSSSSSEDISSSSFEELLSSSSDESEASSSSEGQFSSSSNEDISSSSLELSSSSSLKVQKFAAITIVEDDDGKLHASIDGQYNGFDALNITDEIDVSDVAFERTFSTEGFSTIVFPFDVYTDKLTGIDSVLSFAGIISDNGTKAVGMHMVWKTDRASVKLLANTPYMLKMNATTLGISGPVTLKPTGKCVTEIDGWEFRGTYVYTAWPKEHEDLCRVYGFAAGSNDDVSVGDFVKFAADSWIRPLRAYLINTNVGCNQSNYPQKVSSNGYVRKNVVASVVDDLPEYMNVVVVDKEVTEENRMTVIGEISTRTGEFKILHNYDLKGRKINDNLKAQNIYYGRKVLVK